MADVKLMQAYGQTEMSPVVTLLGAEHHSEAGCAAGMLRSCGRAMQCVEVAIVDATGNEVPRGTVGEIAARGPNMMRGYWNKPEQTRVAMAGDGWLRTGDGGYMDERGYIFIVDRVKDMIVTGGENVFSAEVENAIASHPAVAMCAVIGVPSDEWGEAVHAVVVPRRTPVFPPLRSSATASRRSPATSVRRASSSAPSSPCPAQGRSSRRSSASRTGRERRVASRNESDDAALRGHRNGCTRRPSRRHVVTPAELQQARVVDLILRSRVKRTIPPDIDLRALARYYEALDQQKFAPPPEVRRSPAMAGSVHCEWVDVPGVATRTGVAICMAVASAFRFPNLHARFAARTSVYARSAAVR